MRAVLEVRDTTVDEFMNFIAGLRNTVGLVQVRDGKYVRMEVISAEK